MRPLPGFMAPNSLPLDPTPSERVLITFTGIIVVDKVDQTDSSVLFKLNMNFFQVFSLHLLL